MEMEGFRCQPARERIYHLVQKKHQRKWTKVVTDSTILNTTTIMMTYYPFSSYSLIHRVLIQDEPYASDEYFMQQVAKHHAPMAQRIENDRAEQAVS